MAVPKTKGGKEQRKSKDQGRPPTRAAGFSRRGGKLAAKPDIGHKEESLSMFSVEKTEGRLVASRETGKKRRKGRATKEVTFWGRDTSVLVKREAPHLFSRGRGKILRIHELCKRNVPTIPPEKHAAIAKILWICKSVGEEERAPSS